MCEARQLQEQVGVAKKAKLEGAVPWLKSKGNKDQFMFNMKVADAFDVVGELNIS